MNQTDLGERASRDRGFTLIELVTVITVIGIAVTALAAASTVFMRNSDSLQDKLDASHGAQMTTRYLPSDLQSVAPGGATDSGFIPVCGITPNVLALSWTDLATTPSTRYDALYYLSGSNLLRTLCVDGAVAATTNLAYNVDSATATLASDQVDLTISIAGSEADPGGFQYSIFGSRRT